jgi:hypothetical protein
VDLKSLTREQMLEMLDALEEVKRRQVDDRLHFVPNAGQAPVIEAFANDAVETILVLTGNGGGKTALGTNLALDSASGYLRHTKTKLPVPCRVIVMLDKPEKVTDLWIPEIRKWYPLKPEQLHKRGKPYYSQITFDNGSEILFQFHDQEPMSFESIEGDVFIFDEPPPRHAFIGLRRGGRKKGRKPKFVIIGTPIAAPWLREELYEPWARGERAEIACFRFPTSVNNVNLSEGYVESFARYLSEKEKRVRLEGEFFDLDGLALAHLFKRDRHLIKRPRWPAGWPVVIAIDPAMRKAHTAVMVGITPEDDLIYLRELRVKCAAPEFADHLKQFYKGFRVVDLVCDSMGSGDLTGGEGTLSFIAVLKKHRIRVRATTYDEKDDEAFINMIQQVLVIPEEKDNFGRREPRLKFVEDCKGIISDIEMASWQRERNSEQFKPKIEISMRDYLACLKYVLATRPHFRKGRERPITASGPVSWNNRDRVKLGTSK